MRSRSGWDSTHPTSRRAPVSSGSPLPAGSWRAPTGCGTTRRSRRRSPTRSPRRAPPNHSPSRSHWSRSPMLKVAATTSRRRWRACSRPGRGRMPANPRSTTRRSPMAEFTASVYQNEFLPDGGTDVNAIITVTCSGAGTAGQTGGGAAGEIIIVDTSGSMGPETMAAAKSAAQAALAEIVDGTWFAVISGSSSARLVFPPVTSGPGMVPMDANARAAASGAIERFTGSGGTAISTWLDLAGSVFASVPEVTQRHAILLTDGENREDEGKLAAALQRATGYFQCDCRGAGTDWRVEELRRISQA